MNVAHITEQQRAALRARLLARARVLAEEIGTGLGADKLREEAFDPVSIEEAEVGLSSVQRDTEELRDVEKALERLDRGTYGLCIDCGTALPYVRPDAVPEASRCLHCEAERERTRAAPASL